MRTLFFPFRRVAAALLPLALTLIAGPMAQAQFNASITGTVTDSSGAVIPGATVTLTSTSTQAKRRTTTGGEGFYEFHSLPPDNYQVVISAPNFKTSTFANVAVAAETPRTLDAKLDAGGAAETVTVNANEVPLLQTSDASIGSTIGSAEVTRLPIFGRDPYELLRTAVGTVADGARSGTGGGVFLPNGSGPGQSNFGIFQTENQVQVSAAGQRVTSNAYLIDGVSVDSLQHGGSAIITPNPESVAAITVTSTSYDASDGRNVGAQIRTVSKSGSNSIHGSLFFQYDEPGLNAYQSYGGPIGLPQRVNNKQREWAASIGTPVLRDRLFFFASYEGVSNSNTNFSQQYVPSPELLSYLASNGKGGIVAGVLAGPNAAPRVTALLPISCDNIQTNAPCVAYPDGADVGSPTGAPGQYLPGYNAAMPAMPNQATGGGLDGIPDISYAEVATPARFRGNQWNGRVDWNITQKDLFAASVFISKLDQTSADASTGAQPISDLPFKPLNQSGTLVYIHTFNATMSNEARGNYTRFSDNQIDDSKGLVNWGVPRFEVQGYVFGRLYSGATSSPDSPGIFAENTYEARDTFTKILGTHTIRVGGQFRWEQDNDNLNGLARPDFVFQNIWNYINDAPIFEQVAADPNTGSTPDAQRYFRDHDFSGFIQHDWRATPNLTVNTGLRYEFFSPLANKGFEIGMPLLSDEPGLELVNARLVPRNHLWEANRNNWGPKLGIAWSPQKFNNRMVLRTGFGASYDRLDDVLFINSYQNGPGYFQYGLCCATSNDPATNNTPDQVGINFALGTSDSPFSYINNPRLKSGINPATGTPNDQTGFTPEITVYGANLSTKQPVIYNYSLETQWELPWQMVATIGYQGSVGHHFPRLVDQNFLYPTCGVPLVNGGCPVGTGAGQTPFNNDFVPTTDVYTNYNALNTHLSKRYSHGFNIEAIYTYAKSMDQLSNEGPGALSNQTNPADPKTEYGPSDFDVRHRVTISGLWDLPKYRNGQGLLGQVLSGWQANGIFTWHTGFPWTPVTGQPTVAVVESASTIAPTRPLAYLGGAGNDCSNDAYRTGSNFPQVDPNVPRGESYFVIGKPGPPGIGRNSWNGPCYVSTDMSLAKQQGFNIFGRESQLRFQANFYNIFNRTNLSPITFGSSEATVENTLFGFAPSADAGRVVEFMARFQF